MLPSLLLLLASPAASATSEPEKWITRCGGPFQLCGYVERGTEAERIPQRFEVAKPFSEGFAAVRIDGRYGYIDTTGRVVIAPQYEAAGPFTGNFAEVRVDGRSGAIDRTGRFVVPAEFDRLVPFTGGAFVAKPLAAGVSRSSEQTRLDGEIWLEGLSNLMLGLGGRIYHLEKGWLTTDDLQFKYFDEPARGLIWAGTRNEHNDEQWGLLRSDGTWQVTPRYNHVQVLRETHAVVGSMPDYSLPPIERRQSLLRGAVDRDGKLVVPMAKRGLSYWRGGYGYASEPSPEGKPRDFGKSRKGIVLPNGDLLAGRYFDEVDIREDGKLPRGRIGSEWYSIERDGSLVPDQLESAPLLECENGLTIVRRGDGVGFRRAGDPRDFAQFDDGFFPKYKCPGPFSARRGGKWFIILDDGTVLGGPEGFDSSYDMYAGYAAVKIADKWGIIDRTGAFAVKPSFAKLQPVEKEIFEVGEGDARYWINSKGDEVAKPMPHRRPPAEALSCRGGLRLFTSNGLWGLQDGDGKTEIEPRFRALSCFENGIIWTAAPKGDAWCPLGPNARRREALPCRKTYYSAWVSHAYPEKFSDDPYESSVLWVRADLEYKAGLRDKPPQFISDGGR
jgi:hypothetical protein